MQRLHFPSAIAVFVSLFLPRASDALGADSNQVPNGPAESTRGVVEKPKRYYELPLVGEFGKEIQASGVEDVLSTAVRQKVDYIVFHIDSPGGYVSTADQIARIMRKYGDRLEYIALVEEKSLSATIWVTLGCDKIFVKPGSTIGAAVPFLRDSTTGEVAVDAKFNSAKAAEVASIAESKGHSGTLARAMILMEARAYVWQEPNGTKHVAGESPSSGNFTDLRTLDTEKTILTLTAQEAVDVGLATAFDGGVEKLGVKLGISKWVRKGDYGKLAMDRAFKDFQELCRLENRLDQLLKSRPALVRFVKANTDDAYAKDPDNFTYYYRIDPKSGREVITQESWNNWYANTNAAVTAWGRVVGGLRALATLEQAADAKGEQRTTDDIDLSDHYDRAMREIERLQANRLRGPGL